ncbi:Aste57867_5634 [Aphanomyces stellatus]|uniref:Aste57867_5634 protein n=1 Tax=Aphanomyces stellatus TaxID=120398 RepID=A0A485KHF2_9STRA|nr:hypothetical protein As57867_005621 [Aphanomyces stellatus]VFT82680.1 Aste57867_5634 [Aphanomyces stellatus]
MQLWQEAKEDCLWLAYYLCFIGPMHTILVTYLEYRGKRISTTNALFSILSLTLFSTFLPLYVRQSLQKESPYRLLGVSRYGNKYSWAQTYGMWKKRFTDGQLHQYEWAKLDAAYDMLYDGNVRRAFDTWGPDFQVHTADDMPFNVGLYFLLWSAGVYITTAGRKYQTGRDMSIAALLVMLVLEMTVRMFNYDPRLFVLSQTTPYEVVMAAHMYVPALPPRVMYPSSIFPACLLGYNSFKRVVFVDMLKHKNDCLQYALRNNEKTLADLRAMADAARELVQEKAAALE